MVNKRELRRLAHPHYLVNILLSLSFFALRKIPPLCNFLFSSCEITTREQEILFFLLVVIAFRTRKQGGRSFLPYISIACMFAKIGNVILYFYSDPLYGIIFSLLCLLQMLILPEPSYVGPENISYFRDSDLVEVLRQKKVVWLIELYTSWSPSCIDFASHFSELSAKYSLDNLKFGKIDLARNPDTATKYRISTSTLSQQLPTLIMFKDGKEEMRRPLVNSTGKLVKFAFNFENVVGEYELDAIHKECLQELKQKTVKSGQRQVEHSKSD